MATAPISQVTQNSAVPSVSALSRVWLTKAYVAATV
jgi:hypothetical protein